MRLSDDNGPDFDGAYRLSWKSNYDRFRMSETTKKIKTFGERTGIAEDVIRQKIRDDPIFKWWFVKDPKRQNLYEDVAADWLRQQPHVKDFQRIGSGSLLICAGVVMAKGELRKRGGATNAKSIDFKWNTRGHKVYATHKYTLEGGGAQDNQYEDLHAFIAEANKSTASSTIFIAIADGPYYDTRDGNRKATRIGALRQAANVRNVFAGRSADVPGILRDSIP